MFLRIPRKAWPALALFAPEKFTQLQSRADASERGSEEWAKVEPELGRLVDEFKTWAAAFLAQVREVELQTMGLRELVNRNLEPAFWEPRFKALEKADLTITEHGRLMRHLIKHTEMPVKPVEDALKALKEPWKYRDVSFRPAALNRQL